MRVKDTKGAYKEKVIRCGAYGRKAPYIEVDIYPNTDTRIRRVRRRKVNVQQPKQKMLNDKNTIRYFYQLIKANFTSDDCVITLTYDSRHRPKTEKEMLAGIRNYIDRVNRARKKEGLPKAKYICVNEYGHRKGNIHHHMLISGGLDREKMENLWCERAQAGKKERKPLGYANCDHLQFTDEGIVGLSIYISKDMRREQLTEGQMTLDQLLPNESLKGKRHWIQSKGLNRPWHTEPNDKAYTRKKVLEIIERYSPTSESVKQLFEKKYKGYALDRCYYEWNEYLGAWSISLRMHQIRGSNRVGG